MFSVLFLITYYTYQRSILFFKIFSAVYFRAIDTQPYFKRFHHAHQHPWYTVIRSETRFFMLTYTFSNTNNISLYEQLYKYLKEDILSGTLSSGQKLPSKRNFATNLGVSTITIENAYSQLIAEGYVYSIPQKGFFVSDIPVINNSPVQPNESNFHSIEIDHSSYIADFSSNQTNSDLFPFSIWAKLIRELLNSNKSDLLTNSPSGGIYELKLAIANHLKAFRGMNISPYQVIVGAGTEYLYGLLVQLLGLNKRYAVEDPGYKKISKVYQSHGASCDFISMDSFGVRINELYKKAIDIIHISPSHHFPTGMVMPISRRYELLNWASGDDSRYIIEDDYDSEFRMIGQPIPALQSIDTLEKVIYINTFTKTLASTVRISYMVLPKHLVDIFYSKLSFYSCTVSNFEQYTLARFISEGYFEKHINRLRTHYHTKRDILLDYIKASPLNQYVTISEENSGLHFLMYIDTKLDDASFCKKALNMGIRLCPLSDYYVNNNAPAGYFVINYSSLDINSISGAIDILYRIRQ